MAGRRWEDFRSGNWNEELGFLLLKSIAAVAAVPRQEDFGIDAIATLLHSDGNGTKPVKQIEFQGERLDMTSVHRWREKVLSRLSNDSSLNSREFRPRRGLP
jgi:hypothetical protein